MEKLPVYILAGGKSRRFGSDKARVLHQGQPLILHQVECLKPVASAISVVADKAGKFDDLDLWTIADFRADLGPIGGLQAALDDLVEIEGWLLLTSCDLIGLRHEWIQLLMDARNFEKGAVMFRDEKKTHAMPGLYHKSILPIVELQIAQGKLAMHALAEELDAVRLPCPEDWDALTNVNHADQMPDGGQSLAAKNEEKTPVLDASELARYSRHLLIPEVGQSGQQKLKQGKVLLIGMGGLGCPAAMYLAAAGVGHIGLVDDDRVDASNLQRQILYGDADVGHSKLQVAEKRLRQINPQIKIQLHQTRLLASNARHIISDYDLLIDGSDNFPTRFLVNDACVMLGKPLIHGSIYRFEGQVSVFNMPDGPCYRCLFPQPPEADAVPNCAQAGVLGVLPGVIGMLQATEAIKWLLGRGELLVGRLMLYDALSMRFSEMKLSRNSDCPVCGDQPSITSLEDIEMTCETNSSENENEISPSALKEKIDEGASICILDVREDFEVEICKIENSIHIPLSEIGGRLAEIDRQCDWVVYCKLGGRSANAQNQLQAAGYKNVQNLTGGITAWANEVDETMPTY